MSDHYGDATDTATLSQAKLSEKRVVTSMFGVCFYRGTAVDGILQAYLETVAMLSI